MASRPATRTILKHGVYNSYKNGCRCEPCKEAKSVWAKERKERIPRLPFDPIVKFMTDHERSQHNALIKAKTGKMITLFQADRLCCRFGFHPWQVYGDLYFKDLWEKDEQAKTKGN